MGRAQRVSDAEKEGPPARAPGIAARLNRLAGERRQAARVVLDHPVDILHWSGEAIRVVGREISNDGMQLRCHPATARVMDASTDRDSPMEPGVRIRIPGRGRRAEIRMTGRIIYTHVLSDQQVAVGVQFTKIDDDNAARLARLVENSAAQE